MRYKDYKTVTKKSKKALFQTFTRNFMSTLTTFRTFWLYLAKKQVVIALTTLDNP